MALTLGQALERLAERTSENRDRWKQSLKQRRTEYTDIYGIPYENELKGAAEKTAEFHIRISPDLEYYERYQFKLVVSNAESTINTFRIWIVQPDSDIAPEDWEKVELTDYLEEQSVEWVTGNGYFPEDDDGDSDAGAFYDVLDACSILTAEDRDDDVETILSTGNKIIRIKSDVSCDVTLQLFLKYSTVNR